MLTTLNDVLPDAKKKHYAVGAFNTSNLEITQAILAAAQALSAPVIIAVSEKAIQYAGLPQITAIITGLARKIRIPVVIHLDHGPSFELAEACIRAGFTSVMIDASALPYKENVGLTRKVKAFARRHKVSVEAEIGRLAGIEDNVAVSHDQALYTDPGEARRFARETECDALAIAIGTSHGAYKFKGKPKLRIDILRQIAAEVKIPLVLHGASSVKKNYVELVNKYGGNLTHARGVTDALLRSAIKSGITKINVDTDLRIAFTAGIRQYLTENPADFDPRKSLAAGRDQITRVIRERIRVFGSKGRA
ncbi:MAG TPA: class II fructose-1,6-bisphosphate aldolase [bacterium]